MKKLTFSMLAVLLCAGTAFAQISTGEPNASVLPRVGNRPQAGDFGLYMGASVTQVMDLIELNDKNSDLSYWALPLVNLKYYFADNLEGRIGFEFAAKSTTDQSAYKDNKLGSSKAVTNKNFTRFLPGVAYHFNTKNILDVYVGGQVPIGFDINNERTISKIDGNSTDTRFHQGSFVIGAGIFMGLQFFVADLPFAIGVETGYSGRAIFSNGDGYTTINQNGTKYKFEGNVKETTGNEISKLSHMEGNWGADAALTFTYYFRK